VTGRLLRDSRAVVLAEPAAAALRVLAQPLGGGVMFGDEASHAPSAVAVASAMGLMAEARAQAADGSAGATSSRQPSTHPCRVGPTRTAMCSPYASCLSPTLRRAWPPEQCRHPDTPADGRGLR
jgi:hypothetical protein